MAGFTVSNMQKSLAFYRDQLGFTMKESFPNEGAPMFRLFVTDTVHPERIYWREIIPESNAVLKDFRIRHINLEPSGSTTVFADLAGSDQG